jgi:hypothetical protein
MLLNLRAWRNNQGSVTGRDPSGPIFVATGANPRPTKSIAGPVASLARFFEAD